MFRETVQMLAASQHGATMVDADFVRIQREYPTLLSLVASARKEGDLTNAIFDVHFPTALMVTEKNVEEAMQKTLQKLTELTRWILVAGQYFGFTVFGSGGPIEKVLTPKTQQPRQRKLRKRMKFQKNLKVIDAKLRKKVGYGLRHFVVECAKTTTQTGVAKQIKHHTGIALSSGSMSNLYKRLGLR